MRATRRGLTMAALIALGGFGAAAPVDAQMVGGLVRDRRTGGLVENVIVALRDSADSTVATTRSDSLGEFYLQAPRPGTYTLRFNLGAGPERTAPAFTLATDEAFHQDAYVVEVPVDLYFFEFQVQKPVAPLNNVSPSYPRRMQEEGIGGQVIAQFVVDTTGRAVVETLKAIEFTHREFLDAVREALPRMRFLPAEIEGRPVRQMVQQAFAFAMGPPGIPSMPRRAAEPWPPPLPPLPRTIPPGR